MRPPVKSPTAIDAEHCLSKIAKSAAVPAPNTITTNPRTMYASVLLLNERKNFGPAINPTAVTKRAVPIFETIPKFALSFELQRIICFVSIWNPLPNVSPAAFTITGKKVIATP